MTRFSPGGRHRSTRLANAHLHLEAATISEYADPSATIAAPMQLVLVDMRSSLMVITAEPTAPQRPEMRIPKRPVRAQIGVPPFRLTGTVHIPTGSRPVDGVLNAGPISSWP